MNYQIERLQIPSALHDRYAAVGPSGDRSLVVEGLSRINFFVGSNNSGKSRLIRGIYQLDSQKFLPRDFPTGIREAATHFKNDIKRLDRPGLSIAPFQSMAEALSSFDLISEGHTNFQPLIEIIEKSKIVRPPDLTISWSSGRQGISSQEAASIIQEVGMQASEILGDSLGGMEDNYKFDRLYIPTLRGLRPFDSNKDIFAERTKQDYFEGKPRGSIFTGLSFYQELKDLLLGERSEREVARSFEKFLSTELYQGEDITLIPMKGKDVVYIRIGRERELPVYALGDGVQHLIALTFPLFKSRDKRTLVFIEEPELFLHPGMQRSLLRAFRKFDNHQYFLATHSNHLLDLSLEFNEISIYSLKKEFPESETQEVDAQFVIEGVSTHDKRVLSLLGARVSSVFLSNCTIWVEGITDRRYLAHFLELYNLYLIKTKLNGESAIFLPRQDLHYSFVEYAGGNITHWSFLDSIKDPIEVDRLCAKLMLVADRDNSRAKDERHQKLGEKLGERFYRLECREIENLIAPEVLHKVLTEYGEDARSLESVTQSDYKDVALGEFLESKLDNIVRKGRYASESGTLKTKLDFCEKALAHIDTFESLGEEAKTVTKKIYDFIKSSNR